MRSGAPISPVACRMVKCNEMGYGRYCHQHTPKHGAGVIRCGVCGKPLTQHTLTKSCIIRKGE